jgi:hypothetical protein
LTLNRKTHRSSELSITIQIQNKKYNITYQQTSVFSDITARISEFSGTALLYQSKLEFGNWYQYYFE